MRPLLIHLHRPLVALVWRVLCVGLGWCAPLWRLTHNRVTTRSTDTCPQMIRLQKPAPSDRAAQMGDMYTVPWLMHWVVGWGGGVLQPPAALVSLRDGRFRLFMILITVEQPRNKVSPDPRTQECLSGGKAQHNLL